MFTFLKLTFNLLKLNINIEKYKKLSTRLKIYLLYLFNLTNLKMSELVLKKNHFVMCKYFEILKILILRV